MLAICTDNGRTRRKGKTKEATFASNSFLVLVTWHFTKDGIIGSSAESFDSL